MHPSPHPPPIYMLSTYLLHVCMLSLCSISPLSLYMSISSLNIATCVCCHCLSRIMSLVTITSV